MNGKTGYTCTGVFVASSLFIATVCAHGREVLSLDGVWSFATDPDNRGEAEKWYLPDAKLPAMPLPGYAPTADGTIRVPGIWDNQGYGTENEKLRHQFVGKGWYRRQVEIPQGWVGQRVFLAITGASRYAKLWINGTYLGEHIGFLSAFEYDVTEFITPGQRATITVQVDSKARWEIDSMYGACSLIDYMDLPWGGIWGHVFLETRGDCWLSDLFVQPHVADSSCSVSATISGKADLPEAAKLEVFDKNGGLAAEALLKLSSEAAAAQAVHLQASLPNVELWTPDTPILYRARLSLLQGSQALDAQEVRFGMRQFTADGYRLLLNGKPIMLRGYGDDHIYPEQMAMPSDKQLHFSRLRTIKSFGFNHVRHHSTMMPPEYYDACDEVGIITTSEFPIAYQQFLPGVGMHWKENVPPGTDPGPALATDRREWQSAIKRYRNHPSILCWVRGNELYDETTLRDDFFDIARKLDPQRWFVDTDGINILEPAKERATAPLYSVQFAEAHDPVGNQTKHRTPQPNRPVISHEMGNYVTFSRPDLIDKFQHNFKPFWLAEGKVKLEKLGLSQEAHQWAEKSERLYALLHKYNLESLRKNPYICGYHWWLFQDYWTSSNGLVDHYFRPKSIAKEEVLKFNNDVVLLQDGLDRTYRAKNRLKAKLLVSNFSPVALQGALAWEARLGDQPLARKQIPLRPVPCGELAEAGQIDFELPDTASPARLKIMAELVVGEKHYRNDWAAWLYPTVIRPDAFAVPVLAAEPQIRQLNELADWGVKPIPLEGQLGNRAVYVTDCLFDHRMIDALDRGASVVLLSSVEPCLTPRLVAFRTTWWKAGDTPDKNHCGTFVYDHPLTRAVAPAGWCDDGWFDLLEGANKYVLERMPTRPNVIIRALPSMALIEDDALLFEVGVGKGSLIVSGLNHQRAQSRPETQWLLARLLDYAATMPRPKPQWPTSFVASLYAAPEGCLPGFLRLIARKGDGTTSTWHSYREDRILEFFCRQTKPGNLISWGTTPVPKGLSDDRATFVFAGGLGWTSPPKNSQSKNSRIETDGFVLEVNGKEALRFDTPALQQWKSPDGRAELRFEPRRTVADDQFGLFHLTIARDMLEPGKACQLTVRSLGTGSLRWFTLTPYSDAK